MKGAYYNEFDPFAAAWLRELIKENLIAPGDVDERSIKEVQPDDLRGYDQCHFFAGIGGWSYAFRLAGWDDAQPAWTGSCPCQPFSLAGAQKGFADDRHLWPEFRRLIAECAPATVFGEQVASASEWLGLVRSDLEALGYAVGAMPVQAASAGADHLRDRYWFVADNGSGRCTGPRQGQVEQPRRTETIGTGHHGVGQADAYDARSQGRTLLPECSGERTARTHCLADADQLSSGEGRQQRSGQQRGAGGDQESCPLGDDPGDGRRERWPEHAVRGGWSTAASDGGAVDWVIGADGKARRVKPGVRLLAHGFPARVGLLRGFGNAIDPRPAAAFIRAAKAAFADVHVEVAA